MTTSAPVSARFTVASPNFALDEIGDIVEMGCKPGHRLGKMSTLAETRERDHVHRPRGRLQQRHKAFPAPPAMPGAMDENDRLAAGRGPGRPVGRERRPDRTRR